MTSRVFMRCCAVAVLAFALAVSAAAQSLDDPNEPPGAIVRRQKTEPAPAPVCQLETSLVATRKDGVVELTARVKNVSRAPLKLALASRCPAPPFEVLGLPYGVHPFETCAMGPCVAMAPVPLALAPGETRELGVGKLRAEKSTCSAAFTGSGAELTAKVAVVGGGVVTCAKPTFVDGFSAPPSPPPPPQELRGPKCHPVACGPCPGGMPHLKSSDGCPSCACPEPLGPRVR